MSSNATDDTSMGAKQPGDEHMYDNMGSPEYETIPTGSETPSPDHTANAMSDEEKQAQYQQLKDELDKVEGEISTLRQVLGSKVRYAADLKRRMGITPFQELKQDLQSGIKSIKGSDTVQKTNERISNVKSKITESTAYQKTNDKLHDINEKITHSNAYQKTTSVVKTATEKTSTAVSSLGASMSRKLGDIRNSQTFKSMEERVGGAYSNVKRSSWGRTAKVTGSKSEGNFEEALSQEKEAMEQNGASSPEPLPEEKVPLS